MEMALYRAIRRWRLSTFIRDRRRDSEINIRIRINPSTLAESFTSAAGKIAERVEVDRGELWTINGSRSPSHSKSINYRDN